MRSGFAMAASHFLIVGAVVSAGFAANAQEPPLPRPDHIVVVVEENHGFSDIIGNHAAPFINSLAAKGALSTNFFAVAHPSQPNYRALFSGSTQGVRDNGSYSLSAPTLAGALRNAGYSFIGYAESGSPRKHNPWESFADSQHLGQDFRNFETDFSKLPTVSFVIPNLDHDMHDGSIGQADRWLREHLGAYADWAQTHNSLLIITFDETKGDDDNRVATVITGARVGAAEKGDRLNHYSLLHTIVRIYGLPLLGKTANAPAIMLR